MQEEFEYFEVVKDVNGKLEVNAEAQSLEFFKKVLKAVQLEIAKQLAKEGHNRSLIELVAATDAFIREALLEE